jgi:alpha-glucosidase (family GH31 glycosyl hydrolase)
MHSMNMRVTLWVHPFCNIDSTNFARGVKAGYWVKDGVNQHPGFTSWWNGQDAVIVDTTKPSARDYFVSQLENLRSTYGIDSFKFDAGETSWLPLEFTLYDNQSNLEQFSREYVRIAANLSI